MAPDVIKESVMRIESRGVISAGNNSGISDLVNRLEKGDVIRARVLETSPDEVVLRLSDGTVMKAATVNEPGFRAGEMVNLSVKSKTENQMVLEIVSDPSSNSKPGTDKLLKLLDSLGIEPSKTNLELASELLKYKTVLNAGDMAKALELMKKSDLIDPKTAAFIVSHKIDLYGADHEMLARFLNGELKLGQLLDSLAGALERITGMESADNAADDTTASGSIADEESNGTEETENVPDTANAGNTGKSENAVSNQGKGHAVYITEDTELFSHTGPVSHGTGLHGRNGRMAKDLPDGNAHAPAGKDPMNTVVSSRAAIHENTGKSSHALSSDASAVSDTADNAGNDPSTALQESDYVFGRPAFDQPHLPGTEDGPDTAVRNAAGGVINKDIIYTGLHADIGKTVSSSAEDGVVDKGGNDCASPAGKLKDTINDLFVRIDKVLSANDIDAEKIKARIAGLLSETENLLRSPRMAASNAAENAARSLSLLGETVRMMDLLNSFQVLYYQIPVNLGGNMETAELYVMKRKANRKRIDPHDTVIFLSLDTQNIGRVEALVDVKGNGISMDLRTENQAVSDFIRSNINSLYSGLSECGYKLVNVSYSVISGPAAPTEQEKLLLAKANYSRVKIDYRI